MHITELRLKSHMLADLRLFYTRQLGLPLLEDSGGHLVLQVGGTRLVFEQADAGSQPFYHFAFDVPENQFLAAKTWIEQRVMLLMAGNEDHFHLLDWNAHNVYFYDAAGNIVELIARHNMRTAAAGPFSSESLLYVSEIGLPTPDVPGTVDVLQQELGLNMWRGDSNGFVAMGDELGLCVVVAEERNWFPTDDPAEVHPLVVTMRGPAAKTCALPGLPYELRIVEP